MTLSFTTLWGKQMGEIAGKENYFVEKIWKSFHEYYKFIDFTDLNKEDFGQNFTEYNLKSMRYVEDQMSFLEDEFMYQFNKALIDNWTVAPKLHSIREDIPDRWQPGMKIHFVINNRTKNRFQFAPVIMVTNTQNIEIKSHGHLYEGECTAVTPFIRVKVIVDGSLLAYEDAEFLAINDGFQSLAHFLHYFPKQFTGKIIHWTNLTY